MIKLCVCDLFLWVKIYLIPMFEAAVHKRDDRCEKSGQSEENVSECDIGVTSCV